VAGVSVRAAHAAPPADHRVPATCLAVFVVAWIALGWSPRYRDDWLLENLPTFVGVPLAVLGYRRFRFSDRAYVQATVFVILHTIGSHYTYSEVPAGDWLRDAFGLARNHYDRFVHFAFGILMLRPIRELSFRPHRRPGPLGVSILSVAAVGAWSASYEVLEWLVARVADPAAGTAYLGTQGDPWDAEKDMALAFTGALLASAVESWRPSRRR
jgi:putative membrane protein